MGDVLSFLLHHDSQTPRAVKMGARFGLAVALTQLVVAFVAPSSTAEMVYLGVLTWHLVVAAGSFAFLLYAHDTELADS